MVRQTVAQDPAYTPARSRSFRVASIINHVAVAAGADSHGALIETLIEDRERPPIGTAVVQLSLGTVERCQFPVDPPERYRVGCVADEDLPDCIQGCGIDGRHRPPCDWSTDEVREVPARGPCNSAQSNVAVAIGNAALQACRRRSLLGALGFQPASPQQFHHHFPYAYGNQVKEGVIVQRVGVILEDDIDGSRAGETVRFAHDGTQYEIDLSSKNAQALRSALGRYIEHARKPSAAPRQARDSRNRVNTSAVREWAKAHGKEINDRGRIPASVMKEYEAAQAS